MIRTHARLGIVGCAALVLGGCFLRPSAPTAGDGRGYVPTLLGVKVMVLPVQTTIGIVGDPEAELVFALAARGTGVTWIMPATLRTQLARNPSLNVPLDDLPVGAFLQAQVNRVGDPLYGYLRRMAAISDAQLALIPVQVRQRATTEGRPGAVEVVVAIVSVVDGRVAWFGVVQGNAGDGSNPASLASAADALARTLLPTGA